MKLHEIQYQLKAPKNQRNNFGNYNYRSCEDILTAVKPLLGDSTLTISDEIVEIGGRVYVKATATLKHSMSLEDMAKALDCPEEGVTEKDKIRFSDEVSVTAYAREAETKKGMDDAQITGAASSYARKYALNGLFLIDDTNDADAGNKHDETDFEFFKRSINNSRTSKQVSSLWYKWKEEYSEDTDKYKELNKLSKSKKLELENPSLKIGENK